MSAGGTVINIDWGVIATDFISGILVALVVTGVGAIFMNRYAAQLSFSRSMKYLGFKSTSTNKQSRQEIIKMCKEASLIKIINVSGFHYLNDNEEHLKAALKRGIPIHFLCSDPRSLFLKDIENMEYNQKDSHGKRMREKNNRISDEIFDLIEKYRSAGLEIRFYSTEYRLPFVLAEYEDGTKKAWLTMTLPPYKSTKSFVLRGEKKRDQFYDETANFVDMMEISFDNIWNYGSISLEKIEKELRDA